MKAIVHVTKEVENVEEAMVWYTIVRNKFYEENDVHVNGQVTVKFVPSHPEGTPEKGPKP